ncbi:MAG: DUF455 family protein [Rhodocyclales bacterium GT-UBC]|nr:MAG: DUF455 family protein [Rhodocyclales bacterium GT-UBC]
MSTSLFVALAAALAASDIDTKISLTERLASDWLAGKLDCRHPAPVALSCGRPEQPELVQPKEVEQRNPKTPEGRARLLHAIVHIEFTAINLALDHAARFRNMPEQYYADWIAVAAEEAMHFELLRQRLRSLDHDYGDFPAHAGLWEMAEKTSGDVLVRMALVPRLLEARGLDATPPIQRRLEACGDHESAQALDVILRDEIGHVGLGDRWFRHLCAERQLPAEETYRQLLDGFNAPWPQASMNTEARLAAGFSAEELASLRQPRSSQDGRPIQPPLGNHSSKAA